MKSSYSFYFFSLLLLLIFACDDSNSIDNSANLGEISGIKWKLNYISEDGFGVTAPPLDSLYTIIFSDKEIGLKDNCNACGGEFILDEGEIEILSLLCTLAVCNGPTPFINFSSEINNVKIARFIDGELQLSYKKGGKNRTLHFINDSDTSPEKVILADPENFNEVNWGIDDYSITEAEISEDILTVRASYSGCDVHQFNMVFTNYFLESNPVQANASLTSVVDLCDAAFSSVHTFDLSPLKKAYQNNYGKHGIIDIIFPDSILQEYQLRYEF